MFTWKGLMDGVSVKARGMVFFHDCLLVLLLFIGIFVGGCLVFLVSNSKITKMYTEYSFLESIWTMMPMVVLSAVFIPSLKLLYKKEMANHKKLSVHSNMGMKGYQWYWGFKYHYHGLKLRYKSFAQPIWKRYFPGQVRWAEGEFPVFMDSNILVLLNIRSNDVIHSFSIPGLGFKVDAVPGRTKEYILNTTKCSGQYKGLCSEFCGYYHHAMPITLIVT